MTNTLTVKGSIEDVAKNGDLALAITQAQVVLLVDRSSSMEIPDALGARPRYTVEDEVVTSLQKKYQGKIVIIYFSDDADVCLNGVLPLPYGNTDMLRGIATARDYVDLGLKLILISDGQPSNFEDDVINAAIALRQPVDTVFVGQENSDGDKFLKKLAAATHGVSQRGDLTKPLELEKNIENRMMLSAGKK